MSLIYLLVIFISTNCRCCYWYCIGTAITSVYYSCMCYPWELHKAWCLCGV